MPPLDRDTAMHGSRDGSPRAFEGAVQSDLDSYEHQLNGASGVPASLDGLIRTEAELAALAGALGAESVPGLRNQELRLLASAPAVPQGLVEEVKDRIQGRKDPLGDAFCAIRTADTRRASGAVYTPEAIVTAMVDWAANAGTPARVVEPGAGSARFLMEAARRFPQAELVAVENDPLASLMARANLAVLGKAEQSRVMLNDFRQAKLSAINGRTLYIGNPPYVRHHLIEPRWKDWLKQQARQLGLKASALAGLHVYFFLAIARWAKAGDYGALISAAEWLDVNYGQLVRDLFLNRLGGQSVVVVEPRAEPFPGTATTGAITTFTVNAAPAAARFVRVSNPKGLGNLAGGRPVSRKRLAAETRWSHFTRTPTDVPAGYVELGELCRVHRGQVTGANRVWIAGPESEALPEGVLFPTVTRATELIRAGPALTNPASLRRVIDLPVDLSVFPDKTRAAIDRFLEWARSMGAPDSYVAKHRKAWWSVRLRAPAPILATYMARRPPAFVLNDAGARHLNIAHGLYPREPLPRETLATLVTHLRQSASMRGGRVYAGGLTKFEPREMERIPVPGPATLDAMRL